MFVGIILLTLQFRKVTLSTEWFYRIVGNIRLKSQEGKMVVGKKLFQISRSRSIEVSLTLWRI